jgi:C-terminal processing protease CtpA/Prc
MGRQLRPVWSDISDFQDALTLGQIFGASADDVSLLQARLNDVLQAYENGRGLTGPVSLCATGMDRTPAATVYSKPIILLTDELSFSTADAVAAQFQDAQRGKLFGWRTNGAGGTVLDQNVGFYSEGGTAWFVIAMQCRPNPVTMPGYPATNYVENVGVWPDITWRYATPDNLRQNGAPFVSAFLDAIATEIQKSKQ